MRILFVKRALNTRLRNLATTLAAAGHEVTLLLEAGISAGYNGPGQWHHDALSSRVTVLPSPPLRTEAAAADRGAFRRALAKAADAARADIVVAGNDAMLHDDERVQLAIEALSDQCPVVYDCQDISTDCFDDERTAALERCAAEQTQGVIYTNPVALDWARARYRLADALAFPNYARAADFDRSLPKLSATDGRHHLVYCGSVQCTPPGEPFPWARDLRNLFLEIAALDHPLHLHLGLYPGTSTYDYYADLASVPDIHLYPYAGFGRMMQRLCAYDTGLILYDFGGWKAEVERQGPAVIENRFWSRLDTLKQYEYTLAGLPVLASPAQWIAHWLTGNGFGATINATREIDDRIREPAHRSRLEAVEARAGDFALENRIHELTTFLERVAGR